MATANDTDMLDVTVLMPCLNEAETVATCVSKACAFLERSGLRGEVVVADNGSTDGSQSLAENAGARVINVKRRGYGSALAAGIREARSKWVVMGDADDSYDFFSIEPFIEKLREGYELVMGNRRMGGIDEGAMPWLHKYIGNPLLSAAGRALFKSSVGDWHCGLRAFDRESILALNLHTPGMEFASEMVAQAEMRKLRVCEVPVRLHCDGRSRPPHLNSWSDGWRHLKFLLVHAPDKLFIVPGCVMAVVGMAGMAALERGDVTVGDVSFGVHTLLLCAALVTCGVLAATIGVITQRTAVRRGLISETRLSQLANALTVERMLVTAALLVAAGAVGSAVAFAAWSSTEFGELVPQSMLRLVIPSVTAVTVGVQLGFTAFVEGTLSVGDQDD